MESSWRGRDGSVRRDGKIEPGQRGDCDGSSELWRNSRRRRAARATTRWPSAAGRPNAEVATHEHPFAVKAIVVAGEMWLSRRRDDAATCAPGDRFELDRRGAARRALRRRAAPPTGRRAGTRETERGRRHRRRQAATMSLDWMRLTPALAILSQAALSEPLRSMPRQASSITAALKPALRASSAVQATQKSVARPQT